MPNLIAVPPVQLTCLHWYLWPVLALQKVGIAKLGMMLNCLCAIQQSLCVGVAVNLVHLDASLCWPRAKSYHALPALTSKAVMFAREAWG